MSLVSRYIGTDISPIFPDNIMHCRATILCHRISTFNFKRPIIDITLFFYLERQWLCFHLCWLVCWVFVFFVSSIEVKRMKVLSWNIPDMSGMTEGTFWNLGDVTFNSLDTEFFTMFSMKPVSVSNIMGKRMKGFSWKFQPKCNMTQGTICFLSVFVSNIVEKRMDGLFIKFSWNVSHDINN